MIARADRVNGISAEYMNGDRIELKVHPSPAPVALRVIAIGWLSVGVLALGISDFADRWLWATIGLASGSLFLLASRATRVTIDSRRGAISVRRRVRLWSTTTTDLPISSIAAAEVVALDWYVGRHDFVLRLHSGERVPILERIDSSLVSKQRDQINALLASYVSRGESCSLGSR